MEASPAVNSHQPGAARLKLTRTLWEEMRLHVTSLAPEEACGLIAGIVEQARLVLPITNELHSAVRYSMAPDELLRAFIQIDELGLELVAIYHSHPAGPARPSPTDIGEAFYPNAVYLIWSPGTTGWTCQGFNIQEGVVQDAAIFVIENE